MNARHAPDHPFPGAGSVTMSPETRAFLLLIDRERMCLTGTWTRDESGREHSHAIDLPLAGDSGALGRSLWLNRTVHLHDPRRHLVARLPEGHPLQESFARLGSLACV